MSVQDPGAGGGVGTGAGEGGGVGSPGYAIVPLFVLALKVTLVPLLNERLHTPVALSLVALARGSPRGFSNSAGHQRASISVSPAEIHAPVPK
jgi:hypothetical protein